LVTRTTRLEDCARPTDGITIFYTDLDRSKIDVHRIPKMGRKAVDSNSLYIEGLFIPEADRSPSAPRRRSGAGCRRWSPVRRRGDGA
jgi:alkylation response protein AidB-like acyl-CoA dehydrogenase